MPKSSRRKQSKPQHLLSEEEDGNEAGSQPDTSTPTTGNQSTQGCRQHGSEVTGLTETPGQCGLQLPSDDHNMVYNGENQDNLNGIDGSESDDPEQLVIDNQCGGDKQSDGQSPCDLSIRGHDTESMKQQQNISDLSLNSHQTSDSLSFSSNPTSDGRDHDEYVNLKEALVSKSTSPSSQLANRFCAYCNTLKKSPADLQRHLRKHTGDRPFACRACTKSFKSKRSLQYHQYISHGIEHSDSNIAQRYQLLRKRRLEETEIRAEVSSSLQLNSLEPINLHKDAPVMSSSPAYLGTSPAYYNVSPITAPLDMVCKRQRLDYNNTHMNPPADTSAVSASATMELNLDPQSARAMDGGYKGASPEDLSRACHVCTKVFPKPSDLKRHMMCHTGEKPFKCDFCAKPFRAKSSMHYHMKAAHGVEIELSPGLEERYLRMKTRAHMNMLQRGHLLGLGLGPASDMDRSEIDDIEEDTRSTDSSALSVDSKFHAQNLAGGGKGQGDGSGHLNQLEPRGVQQSSTTLVGYTSSQTMSGGLTISSQEPFQRSQITVENETVLVTRIDGRDLVNGRHSSVYKCYLCGKFFNSLSNMQCHLSMHFEKQLVSYGCCFCDEIFPLKTQMKNHIRRRHALVLQRKASQGDQYHESKDTSSSGSPSSVPQAISNLANSKVESNASYSCRYCRKRFTTVGELSRHFRLHFWNRNCFCRICGKSFRRYMSLQMHISRFHWKTVKDSNGLYSSANRKFNFFSSYRFKHMDHDGVTKGDNINMETSKYRNRLLSLAMKSTGSKREIASIKEDVTVVMPQSPPSDNGDLSDAGTSHHSSDNNHLSESLSDNAMDSDEIRNAPKRSLMSFCKEAAVKSPRRSMPCQSYENNNSPLNFVMKKEIPAQDSNNNESSDATVNNLSQEKPASSSPETLQPLNYPMDATNHLLLAKALAARNMTQLAQQPHTSQPILFPPNLLPPGMATINPSMSLPVAIKLPPAEPHTSKSPSPVSMTSSKSDQSPEEREPLVGYPQVQWNKGMDAANTNWTFNMYYPETSLNDGRKVSSLSRTHSRLPIVPTPINRESLCKPTALPDGRTVFKCPFCSKDFVSFSDINRHMDFHEDIRPYKCQFCSYFARTNSQLKVHMMRHQGIREFCCKLCNYKGVTQSDLNRHMKSQIHMLKSRNACPHCGEGFVTAKNLEKHLDGNCIVKMQKLSGDLRLHVPETVS